MRSLSPILRAPKAESRMIRRKCRIISDGYAAREASEPRQHRVHFLSLLLGQLVLFVDRLQLLEELDEIVLGKPDDVVTDDGSNQPPNGDEVVEDVKIPFLVAPQSAAERLRDPRRRRFDR